VCRHLSQLPWFNGARSVALFEPLERRREVDLRPLAAELLARGVLLYYPRVETRDANGASGEFRRITAPGDFVSGPFGLQEPASHCPVAVEGALDVIVVPCLAIDGQGYRLGYGSGFYDRALERFASGARSIAAAFSFQVVELVPRDAHDLPCDAIVTEQEVRVLRERTAGS
jgi:5-formyltetrahydrofolate cyclo-ligase